MGTGGSRISNEPALPKSFLRRCLLLLLGEHPAHGYELVESLGCFGFDGSDPGGVYRTLRGLEGEGLVSSSWHHSSAGPYRRVYELTAAGTRALAQEADDVAHAEAILTDFLDRYRHLLASAADGNGNGRVGRPASVR
jgi:poly-beta-hydroxybutyrate-responsive repressor